MPVMLAIILGIIQGITEFLPVSSSGHLVVCQHWLEAVFHAEETPLAFDVFVHLATLFVVLAYMRREVWAICNGIVRFRSEAEKEHRLLLLLLLGTLPAAALGFGFKDKIEESFLSTGFAAKGFLFTSVLLALAHFWQTRRRQEGVNSGWENPSMLQALIIGCFQAVAIFPGVSRSGSTIAAALLLGLSPVAAVRFSFLLMIPAVSGAVLLQSWFLLNLSSADMLSYIAGFVATVIVAWFSMLLLVRFVEQAKLLYFAGYTLVLGLVLHLV